jgi:hypothetical protein
MLIQSAVCPIGLPADQAMYPGIGTSNGELLNAQYDYMIRMSEDEMPPAGAFWSVTLYDAADGFFIPNDLKKYSVGENAGMRLGEDGGIAIYIAAEQPQGVPEENWLPIIRRDEVLDIIMRIYDPDLEIMKTWEAPKDFLELRANPHPILGASIKILAPTGIYEKDRLINVGTNRWSFKTELGSMVPLAKKWLLEFDLGTWFFTVDNDFLTGRRVQNPIFTLQAHLVRRFKAGFWAVLDVNYFTGGSRPSGEVNSSTGSITQE